MGVEVVREGPDREGGGGSAPGHSTIRPREEEEGSGPLEGEEGGERSRRRSHYDSTRTVLTPTSLLDFVV